jgi:hypothetical protein
MGHRLEIYCSETAADKVIEICGRFGLPARRIGYTEASKQPGHNEVIIKDQGQEFVFA